MCWLSFPMKAIVLPDHLLSEETGMITEVLFPKHCDERSTHVYQSGPYSVLSHLPPLWSRGNKRGIKSAWQAETRQVRVCWQTPWTAEAWKDKGRCTGGSWRGATIKEISCPCICENVSASVCSFDICVFCFFEMVGVMYSTLAGLHYIANGDTEVLTLLHLIPNAEIVGLSQHAWVLVYLDNILHSLDDCRFIMCFHIR